jgi:hypothetical protein
MNSGIVHGSWSFELYWGKSLKGGGREAVWGALQAVFDWWPFAEGKKPWCPCGKGTLTLHQPRKASTTWDWIIGCRTCLFGVTLTKAAKPSLDPETYVASVRLPGSVAT